MIILISYLYYLIQVNTSIRDMSEVINDTISIDKEINSIQNIDQNFINDLTLFTVEQLSKFDEIQEKTMVCDNIEVIESSNDKQAMSMSHNQNKLPERKNIKSNNNQPVIIQASRKPNLAKKIKISENKDLMIDKEEKHLKAEKIINYKLMNGANTIYNKKNDEHTLTDICVNDLDYVNQSKVNSSFTVSNTPAYSHFITKEIQPVSNSSGSFIYCYVEDLERNLIKVNSIENFINSIERLNTMVESRNCIIDKSVLEFIPGLLDNLFRYLGASLSHSFVFNSKNPSVFLRSLRVLLKKFFIINVKHIKKQVQFRNTPEYQRILVYVKDRVLRNTTKSRFTFTKIKQDFEFVNQKVYKMFVEVNRKPLRMEAVECLILNRIMNIKSNERIVLFHSYMFIRNYYEDDELKRRLIRLLVFISLFYTEESTNIDVKIPHFIKCVCYSKYYLSSLGIEIIDSECKSLFTSVICGNYKLIIGMWFPFYASKSTAYDNCYILKPSIRKDLVELIDRFFVSNFEYIEEILRWSEIA